jgi:Putative prokaryotic signal transducing protein
MSNDSNDPIRVRNGPLTQVQLWHDLLRAAGIESRVVGDNLTAGLGAALPDSVELWVRRADAGAAEAVIAGAGGCRHREPESHPVSPHGHPESGPKPDRSRGPRHGAPPHRPLPSR